MLGYRRILQVACGLILLSPRWVDAQWRSGGMPLCTAPQSQEYPFILEDGRGGVFVAWRDLRDSAATGYDIYAQRLDAAGVPQWGANGLVVCALPGEQVNPNMASDDADGVIIAWQDFRSGTNFDVYAQRLGPSGAPLWAPGGVRLRNSNSDQYLPCALGISSLASDGAGGAIVTWEEYVTGYDSDLHAQHVDAYGAVQWTPYGVPVCSANSFQGCATVVSDGVGGVIIVWEDWRFWPIAHAYAQRLSGGGQAQWAADGIMVSDSAGDQRQPIVIPDGSGGAIVTYSDDGDGNLYAQRVNAAGQVQWGMSGVALCTAAGLQSQPAIVADGAGGAIVAWEDDRANPGCVGGCVSDIYAQHVTAGGTPTWVPNGIALCTAPRVQRFPVLASDGSGGAIAAWADERQVRSEIYVQHVNALGVPRWMPDGMTVASGTGSQFAQVAAPDGAGGAIIVWMDSRNSQCYVWGCANIDLFAARVTGSGVLNTPGGGNQPTFRLLAPRPNPMHAATAIGFELPSPQRVSVEIFGLSGQRVRTLASSKQFSAGAHTLPWDGRNDAGLPLASGLYLLRLSTGGYSESRRIVLVK